MALPRQSRKNQVALQPRKVRLRLVQLAPCMIPSNEVAIGATVLTLTFLPPGIGPSQLWTLDAGAHAEVVAVKEVNPLTNEVILAAATTKAHKPGSEWVPLMPTMTSQEIVFGKWFYGSWAGLNGTRGQAGWLEGEYLRQMIEEGTGSIVLPNAAGSDGVKHYDRFLITTLNNYRVGDEWIEIWSMSTSHAAGDLLFVGSPNEAQVSETEIKLGLVDGMYLMKKQRESNAGFWNNGPRDVFEEYTKQMQVFLADGFDAPANYPASPSTAGESSDKRFKMSNAIASPVNSNVRLLPLGSGVQSYVRFATPIKIGTTEEGGRGWEHSQEAHEIKQRRFRFECTFTTPSGSAPNMYLEFVTSGWAGGAATAPLYIGLLPTEGILSSYQGSAHNATQIIQKTAANSAIFGSGQHTVVIEGRGRWVFFYCDGVLLGILPTTLPAQELYPQVTFLGTSNAATTVGSYGANYMDVDYMLLREAVPCLMRSTTDKGDYQLPGLPSGSGLKGEYFSDTDLASDFNQGAKALAPLRQPFATRVDGTLNFSPGTKWWPEGVVEEGNFSVRWTGAVYLDLSHYDYLLQVQCYAGARVWIGKTRWDEQVLDCWQNGKGSEWLIFNEDQLPHLKGTALSPGPLYGQPSGWYPIMVEFVMGNPHDLEAVTPNVVLFYERSDLAMAIPMNAGPYAHIIAADVPWWYFPLDHSGYNGANFFFDSAEIGTFSLVSGNSKVPKYQPGPVANDPAFSLPGETTTVLQYAHGGETDLGTSGWTSWTFEGWINPTNSANGFGQMLFCKTFVYQFNLTATGHMEALVGNGTSWGAGAGVISGAVIASGAWTHISATYDGTNLRLYINGVLSATGGASAGQTGTNSNKPGFGYYPQGGAGAHEMYQLEGGIAHIAIYKNKVLSAATLLSHAEAANAAALLNGGTVQASSMVPLSPQGFFAQQVRSESHYELIRSFAEEWGLQWTCRPMSLESGEFPGRMCPRLQEGRQTDYVIDHSNVIGPQVTILADDTADTLLIDAQGLADNTGAGQLQAEVFNFFELSAHALTNTEYDSPGDIQVLQQLITRANSLLALRSSPWTQLEAQARGKRTLTDTWPLSGILAEFPWLPGEGIRAQLPLIGVEDSSTRQLWGMKWPIFPDGIGAPSPVFKQRPRSVKEAIRHVITALRSKTRNYQGQFAIQDASLGGLTYNNGVLTVSGGAGDQYTRMTLPPNLTKVKAATLSVQTLTRTPPITWTLEINGVSTGIVVTSAGPINVLPYLARDQETTARMYARLVGTGTGSGSYTIKLETQVII